MYYKHSGRFSLGGLLVAAAVGCAGSLVLAYVYAWGIILIPEVHLAVVLGRSPKSTNTTRLRLLGYLQFQIHAMRQRRGGVAVGGSHGENVAPGGRSERQSATARGEADTDRGDGHHQQKTPQATIEEVR